MLDCFRYLFTNIRFVAFPHVRRRFLAAVACRRDHESLFFHNSKLSVRLNLRTDLDAKYEKASNGRLFNGNENKIELTALLSRLLRLITFTLSNQKKEQGRHPSSYYYYFSHHLQHKYKLFLFLFLIRNIPTIRPIFFLWISPICQVNPMSTGIWNVDKRSASQTRWVSFLLLVLTFGSKAFHDCIRQHPRMEERNEICEPNTMLQYLSKSWRDFELFLFVTS